MPEEQGSRQGRASSLAEVGDAIAAAVGVVFFLAIVIGAVADALSTPAVELALEVIVVSIMGLVLMLYERAKRRINLRAETAVTSVRQALEALIEATDAADSEIPMRKLELAGAIQNAGRLGVRVGPELSARSRHDMERTLGVLEADAIGYRGAAERQGRNSMIVTIVIGVAAIAVAVILAV